MTDLRARARKTADLIIDRLLEKAGFAVIPTVEREHAAGVVAEALAEQIEAAERVVMTMAEQYRDGHYSGAWYDAAIDIRGALRRSATPNVMIDATAIRQAGEKKNAS